MRKSNMNFILKGINMLNQLNSVGQKGFIRVHFFLSYVGFMFLDGLIDEKVIDNWPE